jgi:hypothetical protein
MTRKVNIDGAALDALWILGAQRAADEGATLEAHVSDAPWPFRRRGGSNSAASDRW